MSSFKAYLASYDLLDYYDNFISLGCTRPSDLSLITSDDLEVIGMTIIDLRKFENILTHLKDAPPSEELRRHTVTGEVGYKAPLRRMSSSSILRTHSYTHPIPIPATPAKLPDPTRAAPLPSLLSKSFSPKSRSTLRTNSFIKQQTDVIPHKNKYFFSFAVDQYENRPNPTYAMKNAITLENKFIDLNYSTTMYTNADVTFENIRKLIEQTLYSTDGLEAEDLLVFSFHGHCQTLKIDGVERIYYVPSCCPDVDTVTPYDLIPIQTIIDMTDILPVNNVVILFDNVFQYPEVFTKITKKNVVLINSGTVDYGSETCDNTIFVSSVINAIDRIESDSNIDMFYQYIVQQMQRKQSANSPKMVNVSKSTQNIFLKGTSDVDHRPTSPVPNVYEFDGSSITIGEEIGSGHFGRVCKGELSVTVGEQHVNFPVALKMMKIGAHRDALFDQIKECERQATFNHPNIVKCFGWSRNKTEIVIIQEHMKHGSLLEFLKSKTVGFALKIAFAIQICRGLKHLHDNIGVIHRDLAARNICITSDTNGAFTAKLIDFGLSRKTNERNYYSLSVCENGDLRTGIPLDRTAPECLSCDGDTGKIKATKENDIWALGIVLYELFSDGMAPYAIDSPQDVIRFVREGNVMSLPSIIPDEIRAIILQTWRRVPKNRISIDQIMKKLLGVLPWNCESERVVVWLKECGVPEGHEILHEITDGKELWEYCKNIDSLDDFFEASDEEVKNVLKNAFSAIHEQFINIWNLV